MGPSGSGKTTLLNLIGGLDAATEGSITIGGVRIDKLGESALAKWRASHVGFVFQFYNLLSMLSAQKNVEVPLLLTELPAALRRTVVANSSQMVFAMKVEPALLWNGLKWALAIALIGGLLPAIRVARMSITGGLREL
jgi:ABC-type lipoprotein export system ATPase subunit